MVKAKPFKKGNPGGPGRPKGSRNLGPELVHLADEAATLVITEDAAIIRGKAKTRAQQLAKDRAKDRLSRMCKGRVPTRIAIAGDEGGEPVPISYIEVGGGIAVEPTKPKKVSKAAQKRAKKGKLRPVPKVLRGKKGFGG